MGLQNQGMKIGGRIELTKDTTKRREFIDVPRACQVSRQRPLRPQSNLG
jgi:hypothetical protein